MDQHLFILGMNDSGTTFLQNVLSMCNNCVSFQGPKFRNGIEGQGVVDVLRRTGKHYPKDTANGVVKVFSEKKHIWQNPSSFNWGEIKTCWETAWKQNGHYNTANPRVLLEKTPMSLYSVDIYRKEFPNCKFLIIHRDPYAVCEGMRRTVKKYKGQNYDLKRCAAHWIECSRQQIENIKQLCPDDAMWFTYENMVEEIKDTQNKIGEFVPALSDVNFTSKVICHSMDKPDARGVVNYNIRHLKNLSKNDFADINSVLRLNPEIMAFFKYSIKTDCEIAT